MDIQSGKAEKEARNTACSSLERYGYLFGSDGCFEHYRVTIWTINWY